MIQEKIARLIMVWWWLFIINSAFAQGASQLTISKMNVEPGTNKSNNNIVISCRIKHLLGSSYIKRVAATIYHGDLITSYPLLYDDGTHGDKIKNDGIYSLELKPPEAGKSNKIKIIFSAVDNDGHEIESEPFFLSLYSSASGLVIIK